MFFKGHLQIARIQFRQVITQLQYFIQNGSSSMFPFSPELILNPVCLNGAVISRHETAAENPFKDGIMWAVQKNRRSLEKRMARRVGNCKMAPAIKMLKPREDLIQCVDCGSWHELNCICLECYKKVKKDAKFIQHKIAEVLQLNPIEKEVELIYEGEEPKSKKDERILVEIPKKRLNWFSKNLLAQSAADISNTSSVIEETNYEIKVENSNEFETSKKPM